MVLNVAVNQMDRGEPLSEWLGRDPHVQDDLVVGDRVAVEFPGGCFEGEPVRFDAMGGGSAHRGHNVLIDAGADDAEDGLVRVRTRRHGGVEVLLNRPGAGLNETAYDGPDASVGRA